MRVLSNLEFKNSTYILNKFEDFPENPSEGTVIFKENGLYIYSLSQISGNLEWLNILDFTRVNSSFKFEQGTESTEWNIAHNLNTQDLFVIVYDSEGNKQVESEIQFQSDNEIKLIFSEPISGKALLFGASVISSPSNIYTKEEIDELLKNIDTSGGNSNIILPENGIDGQVLIKDSNTESGLNWSDKIDGKSAYEIAKEDGFEGTEEEWLKSLKGTNGVCYNSDLDWDNIQTFVLEKQSDTSYDRYSWISPDSGYVTLDVTLSNSSIIQITRSGTGTYAYLNNGRYGQNSIMFPVSKNQTLSMLFSASTSSNVKIFFTTYKKENIYSTDETIIGTWIDGKPIYRLVITGSGPIAINTNHSIDIPQLNVDKLINFESIWEYSQGKIFIESTYGSISGNNVSLSNTYVNFDDNKIHMLTNSSSWCNSSTVTILEYTKTTD